MRGMAAGDDLGRAERGTVRRRSVLKTVGFASAGMGLGSVGVRDVRAQDDSTRRLTLTQGSTTVELTPLSNGQTIEEFYNYANVQANTSTGIETSDTSLLFFWNGPNGLSLVVIHDRPNDGSGGAVTFDIGGVSGEWVVPDDPGDLDSRTDTSPDWSWASAKTDGGAYRGDFSGDFTLTIEPAFNDAAERTPLDPGRITEWQALSGDPANPDRTSLALDETVTISPAPVSEFEQVRQEKLNLAGRIETASEGRLSEVPRVTSTLDRLEAEVAAGNVDSDRAVEAVERMKLGERLTEDVLAVSGPYTNGRTDDDLNLAVDTSDFAVGAIIDSLLSVLSFRKLLRYIPFGDRILSRGTDLLTDYINDIVESLLNSGDFIARRVRQNTSDVAADLFENLGDAGLSTGSQVQSEVDQQGGPISSQIADLILGQATTEIVDTSAESIDETLTELDAQLGAENGVSFGNSLSDAQQAATDALDDARSYASNVKNRLETANTAVDYAGWLGFLLDLLAVIGSFFFGVGAIIGAISLIIDIAVILLQLSAAAAGFIAIDLLRQHHAENLEQIVAGRPRANGIPFTSN
jgi:hypothetical protein